MTYIQVYFNLKQALAIYWDTVTVEILICPANHPYFNWVMKKCNQLLLETTFHNTVTVCCKSYQSSVNRRGIRSLPFPSVVSGPDTVTNTEGQRQTPESLRGPPHKSPSASTRQLIHTDYLPQLSVWSSSAATTTKRKRKL